MAGESRCGATVGGDTVNKPIGKRLGLIDAEGDRKANRHSAGRSDAQELFGRVSDLCQPPHAV